MFNKLGIQTNKPSKDLEVFTCPLLVSQVKFETKEVTALCPVTEQPDLYTVVIDYAPNSHCIETKSLKLYLWTFRNRGLFAESLAGEIAQDVFDACLPKWCKVTAVQQIRGGIQTTVSAEVTSG
jgi:7-cyano-7-deazaguanine reductase